MKSSTSVVELVMLLCSQVCNLSLCVCVLSVDVLLVKSILSLTPKHDICSYVGIRQNSDLLPEIVTKSVSTTLKQQKYL